VARKRNPKVNLESKLIAILSKRESQNSEHDADDDRLFLLSLLPLMKQMPLLPAENEN
jgi:hypothetical protein